MRKSFLATSLLVFAVLFISGCGGEGNGGLDDTGISMTICEQGWIESSTPPNGATNIPANAEIKIIAKEGVDMSGFTAEDFSIKVSDETIEFSLTIDEAMRTVTLTLLKELPLNVPILISSRYGACSRSGTGQHSFTFATGTQSEVMPPVITSVSPPDLSAPSAVTPSLKPWTRATFEWIAPGDDGDVGTASRYEVRYSTMPIENENDFENAAPVIGAPTPQIAGTAEQFTLPRMKVGKYYFAVRAFDEVNNASPFVSKQIEIVGRATKGLEPVNERGLSDYMGRSIAGDCDINSDGLKDVIVGIPYDDTAAADAGRVGIYLGKVGSEMGPDIWINGTQMNSNFGWSVSCGDFNGDGYDDIAVGSPYYDRDAAKLNSGGVFLFYGKSSFVGPQILSVANADVIFKGMDNGDNFGWSVSSLGDLDGDHDLELAIVATNDMILNGSEGVAYIFYGIDYANGTQKDALDADVKVQGETANSRITKVASAGDIDGDGKLDIVFATTPYPAVNKGSLYVLLGKNNYPKSILLANDSDIILRGILNDDLLAGKDEYNPAFSVSGDLNGDGVNDLVLGIPGFSNNTGKVSIFYGRSDWASVKSLNDADVTITGKFGGDMFGWSLDAGGDFNKDGKDDLLVGSSRFTNNAVGDAGGAFIFFGHGNWNSAMNSLDADTIISTNLGILHNIGISPISGGDRWAESVCFLGDTDGDGYDDVALGAPYAEGNDSGGLFIIQ